MNAKQMKSRESNLTEEYYQALVAKDASYEGIFIAAVKTTGIFCRPTCRARKPKKENVEFYRNVEEAIFRGYKPCKICRPLQPTDEIPVYIKNIVEEIFSDPSIKLKDRDLRIKGFEPHQVRRWFVKNYGITFHSYQRVLRLYNAFRELQNGKSVAFAAFEVGYESLSGFNESFKSIFGVSPSRSQHQDIIDKYRLETLLGTTLFRDLTGRLNNKGNETK